MMIAILMLSACKKDYSVEYYFTHPYLLHEQILACQDMSTQNSDASKNCNNASEALLVLREMSQAFMTDHDEFGDKVIKLQMKVANLQQQIIVAKASSDNKKIIELQAQLNSNQIILSRMLFIIGQFVRP